MNGYKNRETWNVVLWINNDEGLYRLAQESGSYETFKEDLKEIWGDRPIAYETPDGIAWSDSGIDLTRMAALFKELAEDSLT
jgi:hypothetical protein